MLKQIVYLSHAIAPMDEPKLIELLKQACTNNEKHGITGILLYGNAIFIQCFEGPRDNVNHLYATLKQDQRHTDVETIYERDIDKRSFDDWTMAYRPLRKTVNHSNLFELTSENLEKALANSAQLDMRVFLQSFCDVAITPDVTDEPIILSSRQQPQQV